MIPLREVKSAVRVENRGGRIQATDPQNSTMKRDISSTTPGLEVTMHANDESNKKEKRKRCVNTPRFEKGAHKHNETPKHSSGQPKYTNKQANEAKCTNKQANEVCEYFSF